MIKWKVISKNKFLCSIDEKYLSYSAGVLYIQEGLEGKAEKLLQLPIAGIKKILIKIRILERLLRLEPRLAMPLNQNECLLSYQGKIYTIDIGKRAYKIEHSFRNDMNNILGFCVVAERVLYGEYCWNVNRGPVSVFERRQEGEWEKVYTFDGGEITHIHLVVYDKFRECFWILTGDDDKGSGIWKADLEFSCVEPIFRGKQKYRSDFLVPLEKGLVYATDTPLENNAIYFTCEGENGVWIEPEVVCEIPGPCIYGKVLDNQDYVIATSVEPDPSLPTIQYRLTKKLGAGVKDRYSHVFVGNEEGATEILSFEKDAYKNWLFQFGNLLFPNVSLENGFLCTGQSLKGIDGKTIKVEYRNIKE